VDGKDRRATKETQARKARRVIREIREIKGHPGRLGKIQHSQMFVWCEGHAVPPHRTVASLAKLGKNSFL
jgi:hypothetical protein